jgi:hypothetical protein
MKEFGVGSVISCRSNFQWGYAFVCRLSADTDDFGDNSLYKSITGVMLEVMVGLKGVYE